MKRIGTFNPIPAFTLIELLVVISIIALLVAILLPAIAGARGSARTVICSSNMKQLGIAYASYSNDFKESIASYSWKPNRQYSTFADLNPTPGGGEEDGKTSAQSASFQATDIVRRLTGRTNPTDIDVSYLWVPNAIFTHLVLNDFLSSRLPEKMVVCPEDQVKLAWQLTPLIKVNADGFGTTWHAPFASSYTAVACSYSHDQVGVDVYGNAVPTASPTGSASHLQINTGEYLLGGRKITDVAFPASKVLMFDYIARHRGRPAFCSYSDTAQPLLFFDSSVRFTSTRECNPGANPNQPGSDNAMIVTYKPSNVLGEPPTRSGKVSELVTAYFQWTRSGLKGIDLSGKEVPQAMP